MRRKIDNLLRSQQSIFYYTDLEGQDDPVLVARPDYLGQFYPRMLIEDVRLSIMPIGEHSTNETFRVFITPADQAIEHIVAAGLWKDRYTPTLTRAVCEFVRRCSATIMAFEEAIYEIVYLSVPETQKVTAFELVSIQPRTLKRRWGKLVQYVPASVAEARRLPRYITLSPERILFFKAPRQLKSKLKHIMEDLASLSGATFPDFALPNADSPHRIPFDSTIHTRARSLAVADATKLIGWNAQEELLPRGEKLEYYFLYRQLRFYKFKIQLRDSILRALNEVIAHVGKTIGFSGSIETKGLPTLEDIAIAHAHLQAGNKPFDEVMRPFRL